MNAWRIWVDLELHNHSHIIANTVYDREVGPMYEYNTNVRF